MNWGMIKNLIFIVFVICCAFSCSKPAPQLPSNKGSNVDENTAKLLEFNKELALKEDSALQLYVEKQNGFAKNKIGFWYKIIHSTQGSFYKQNDYCSFEYKMLMINGKLLQSKQQKIVIGKKEVVTGLEEAIKMMHKGESGIFIIPWYLAYGMDGNKPLIPPYTSLIFQVRLF
jgi:FKBP-type peptidyl-prolyl cis-trans isomerase